MGTTSASSLLHAAPAAGFDEPFAMLSACHDRVRRSLALLSRLAEHVRQLGAADAQARSAAADVLRYFDLAALTHHEDEERHVLPRLAAADEPQLRALATRLHEEHDRMAAAWAEARPAVAGLAAGDPWDSSTASAHFERWRFFASLYEGHLEAEDQVAFPQAALRVPAAALQTMGEEMAARRGSLGLRLRALCSVAPTMKVVIRMRRGVLRRVDPEQAALAA